MSQADSDSCLKAACLTAAPISPSLRSGMFCLLQYAGCAPAEVLTSGTYYLSELLQEYSQSAKQPCDALCVTHSSEAVGPHCPRSTAALL